jgi:hypothetical protein
MRSVGYSPMLTFDSGTHLEVKASRGVPNLMQSEQKLALAVDFHEDHKFLLLVFSGIIL